MPKVQCLCWIWLSSYLVLRHIVNSVEASCVYRLRDQPYSGHMNVTGNGLPCQRWDSQFPHRHIYTSSDFFPDVSIGETENYCREPTGHDYLMGRPWCYTLEGDDSWGFCDVPLVECFNGGTFNSTSCSCVCNDSRYWGNYCEKVLPSADPAWPSGNYALPLAAYGCPLPAQEWLKGGVTLGLQQHLASRSAAETFWRFHYNYMGPYLRDGFMHGFCLHQDSEDAINDTLWIPGAYCLYKVGTHCPQGFNSSSAFFSSRFNLSRKSYGTLPNVFKQDNVSLEIQFCCRQDGMASVPVSLPYRIPFYLIKGSTSTQCQMVERMRVTEELFPIDEDVMEYDSLGNPLDTAHQLFSAQRPTLHLCFYESYEIPECFDPRDLGKTYRGSLSRTSSNKTCDFWERRTNIYFHPTGQNKYHFQYMGMEGNNHCRLPDLRQKPWCYFHEEGNIVAWEFCDVPACDIVDEKLENIALGKPTSSSSVKHPSTGPHLAVDFRGDYNSRTVLSDSKCFISAPEGSPWLQIDLQAILVIKSVDLIINQQNAGLSPLRHLDIHIGMTTEDFKDRGATLCRHDVTVGLGANVWLDCVQPTRGQYLTLQNAVFQDGHDRSFASVLRLCELKVYAYRTNEGLPLGVTAKQINWRQFTVSSSATRGVPYSIKVWKTYAQLYRQNRQRSRGGWCADPKDNDIFFQVNLGNVRKIESIVTRGLDTYVEGVDGFYVSVFTISWSMDGLEWFHYKDALGQTTEFTGNTDNFSPVRNMFNPPIRTRYFRINVKQFVRQACLRFEIFGEKNQKEIQCGGEVSDTGVIRSPNFGEYYGEGLRCSWDVSATPGSFVVLQFTYLDLEARETGRMEGDYLIDPGQCTDTIHIYVEKNDGSWASLRNITSQTKPPKIISPRERLRVTFTSCLRYSIPSADGFEAVVNASECAGYGVGQSTCTSTHLCTAHCGYLASVNYPANYSPLQVCRWHIKLPPGKYVALTFLDLGISDDTGECFEDYLEIQDVDVSGKPTPLTRICGSVIPSKSVIYSSRNEMLVSFISDERVQGRGFLLSYSEYVYNVSSDIYAAWLNERIHCGADWEGFHGNCYRLYLTNKTSWIRAEMTCQEDGGHLVSIRDQAESYFVHFLLTTVWKVNSTKVYIGLNDREKEGHFQWADGSQLTFTSWYTSEDRKTMSQPDGGEQEDCSVIVVGNIHSTAYWHDIACAYDNVSQFICQKSGTRALHGHVKACQSDQYWTNVTSCLKSQFTCKSGECISAVYVCNGYGDCMDHSDEIHCDKDCGHLGYKCDNGECVSISTYCDFKEDCRDGSDEHFCARRMCYNNEFRCDNGQCIPADKRCDVERHCLDGSDEIECTFCETKTSFKCYDGRCIPKSAVCDGQIDCNGLEHEDEGHRCLDESAKRSCGEWRESGYHRNGFYDILPRHQGSPSKVKCVFEENLERVKNVFHHNLENRTHVNDVEWNYFGEFKYYQTTAEDIRAVVDRSTHCQMFMKYECKGSMLGKDAAGIYTYNDSLVEFTSNPGECDCLIADNCDWNTRSCTCDTNVNIWLEDRGYLNDSDFFPLRKVKFGDTGLSSEEAYHTIGALECYEDIDLSKASQGFVCRNQRWIQAEHRCLHQYDKYGYVLGCRDLSHLEKCEKHTCPSAWFKCPDTFCIPFKMVCDGKNDCPLGSDEKNCGNFSCPGMYRCHLSENCIPNSNICDGKPDCQHGDDEQMCHSICPHSCNCEGFAINCSLGYLNRIPYSLSEQARLLDFSYTLIKELHFDTQLSQVGRLYLSHCRIESLETETFKDMINLLVLDLSYNAIEALLSLTFNGLSRLRELLLHGNRIGKIEPGAFIGVGSLPKLSLISMSLNSLNQSMFEGLGNVSVLNLSSSEVKHISSDAFRYLPKLTLLDLRNNSISEYPKDVFLSLLTLAELYSDTHAFCCLAPWVPSEQCFPQRDELSSCEDLMRLLPLRISLWIIGIVAMVGNIFVIIYRLKKPDGSRVNGFLLTNLAVSDFLMGIYLVAIAIVDTRYKGEYFMHEEAWKSSIICDCLGFLVTVAAEVSMMTLATLTFDRFSNIVFPFGKFKLNLTSVKGVLVTVWMVSFTIAGIPLFPSSYFEGKFYSRTGVCIPLHLTATNYPGWEYSIAIFMGLNSVIFVFIAFGYWYIYHVIKNTPIKRLRPKGQSATKVERAVALKMALLVFTNVLCWLPIFILGCVALSGQAIEGDVYAWIVVFVLPINSAFDPLLYTISTIRSSGWSMKAKKSGFEASFARSDYAYVFSSFQSDTRVTSQRTNLHSFLESGMSKLAFYKIFQPGLSNKFSLCSEMYIPDDGIVSQHLALSGSLKFGKAELKNRALEAYFTALGKTLANLHQNYLTIDWQNYSIKFLDMEKQALLVRVEGGCYLAKDDTSFSKDQGYFHRLVRRLLRQNLEQQVTIVDQTENTTSL